MIADILYFILFVLLGLCFPYFLLNERDKKFKPILVKLLFFHFLMGFAYFLYTNNGGGDAWGYWKVSKEMSYDEFIKYYNITGTYFLYSLNYIPSNILGMSFFANTMFFSLLGYIGLFFFFLTALRTIPFNTKFMGYKLFPLVWFFPNLHFWSAGIGKDTLLFLCIGMFVFGMLNIAKRLPILLIALLLSYLLRPHITLFLVVSFGLAYFFSAKISIFKRIAFSTLLAGLSIFMLPTVMKFTRLEDTSVESFNDFSEKKVNYLNRAGSGSAIDVSSYPFPLKIFTFLFRPMFFDVRNLNGLIAALENLILLIVFIKAMRNSPVKAFRKAPLVIKGLVFFLFIGTVAFSQSLGNLGIMIRMRNMFLPSMLIFLMWCFSYQKEQRIAFVKRKVQRLPKESIENDSLY